jgi:hypothetical protein
MREKAETLFTQLVIFQMLRSCSISFLLFFIGLRLLMMPFRERPLTETAHKKLHIQSFHNIVPEFNGLSSST